MMHGAIKFGQQEHIAGSTTSKDMWDCLHMIYVTYQDISVHYHYQDVNNYFRVLVSIIMSQLLQSTVLTFL